MKVNNLQEPRARSSWRLERPERSPALVLRGLLKRSGLMHGLRRAAVVLVVTMKARPAPSRRPAAGAWTGASWCFALVSIHTKDTETVERARFPNLPPKLTDRMDEKLMLGMNVAGTNAADTPEVGFWGKGPECHRRIAPAQEKKACFQDLAITDCAAVNMGAHISL